MIFFKWMRFFFLVWREDLFFKWMSYNVSYGFSLNKTRNFFYLHSKFLVSLVVLYLKDIIALCLILAMVDETLFSLHVQQCERDSTTLDISICLHAFGIVGCDLFIGIILNITHLSFILLMNMFFLYIYIHTIPLRNEICYSSIYFNVFKPLNYDELTVIEPYGRKFSFLCNFQHQGHLILNTLSLILRN